MKTFRGAFLASVLLGLGGSLGGAVAEGVPAPERAAVLAVVQKFFDAMAAGDADALRSTAVPTFQLHAVRGGADGTTVTRRTLDEFAARLGARERLLERMWNPTVLVQDRMAMVWTPYDFHRDGQFSHTGIDVFTLARTDAGWKLVDLAFTVEPGVPSRHPAGPPLSVKK